MREIVVVSGKGGTGKTSLTAAFADLAGRAVVCDLDVDAADLHLVLTPALERREDFFSGHEAVIDPARCTGCGICATLCRFGAVLPEGGGYRIDPTRCEGCKVCVSLCPEAAVNFPERRCGEWFTGQTRFGTLVHARLTPGAENSGRLVTLLKKEARAIALADGLELVLCDGSPGIGCPVISSLAGANLAVAVTEPTPSGRHDLERLLELCARLRTRACCVLNKCDLNAAEARAIEELCAARDVEVVARLPHDDIVFEAMLRGRAVTELPGAPMATLLKQAWNRLAALSELGRPAPWRP
ncbi:Electron transport complex subunit RsxB [Fundidesulfovibrio magnetotacticus]|uniref:Electron transport complex subunit RsxB n=1 Tax=Fundidesulfovibrio magnetotacticus TaxID=2730080 RepID=A0A6V8LWK2_9BACT|nr:ATP-binding protein [Fundidesulfovibrio magnetotacticus]GFK94459.1 Electron transport complex subunit RsxB [Fundidesulfovibrio magnetotacticus]